jgi:hypothetical protein
MPDDLVLTFSYVYAFEDGTSREFDVRIDERHMRLILPDRADYPAWTALDFCRCPNCPLDAAHHAHCPSAVALTEVVDFCKDRISHEKVEAIVATRNRTFVHTTPLHVALSSLIGVCMATGGCPVMERLRPMARFHLPFADDEETMFRAMSAYLLGQYFIMKQGGKPDWQMENLVGMYDEIKAVNRSFCDRVRAISTKDSNVNAVIGLDCFADAVIFSLNQHFMEQLELLYQAYVK